MTNWIKITDELPPTSKCVLVTDGCQICIGFLLESDMRIHQVNTWNDLHDSITHWQLLPKLPSLEPRHDK